MKLAILLKATMILGIFMISNLIATETVMKKAVEATETACEDPCQTCQRVVYQLKFQGIADCYSSGPCRGTCEKVREAWGTPFNPFEPFLKDVFGKCEICFRAGHCQIAQCKEQERNEIEVINRVINSSHLTAKVNPDLLVSFPDQPDEKALIHTIKVNSKVQQTLKKELNNAVHLGSAEYLIPKVQNLVRNYFDQPTAFVRGGPGAILANQPTPVSTASISYWNDQANKGVQGIEKVRDAVNKLNDHVLKVSQLKSVANHDEKKSANKLIKKEKKEINKLINKTREIEKSLDRKEKTISRLIANPQMAQDAQRVSSLNNSLSQIQQIKAATSSISSQLHQDKRNLYARHTKN